MLEQSHSGFLQFRYLLLSQECCGLKTVLIWLPLKLSGRWSPWWFIWKVWIIKIWNICQLPTWYSGGGCTGTLSLLSLRLPFSPYALLSAEMQLLWFRMWWVGGLWWGRLEADTGLGGQVGRVFHLLLVEILTELFKKGGSIFQSSISSQSSSSSSDSWLSVSMSSFPKFSPLPTCMRHNDNCWGYTMN